MRNWLKTRSQTVYKQEILMLSCRRVDNAGDYIVNVWSYYMSHVNGMIMICVHYYSINAYKKITVYI